MIFDNVYFHMANYEKIVTWEKESMLMELVKI